MSAVFASLALICATAFSSSQGWVALAEQETALPDVVLNAEKTLNEGIAKLSRKATTLQQASLNKEMNYALSAIKELKSNLPVDSSASDSSADAALSGADAQGLHATPGSGPAAGSRGRVARLHSKSAAAQEMIDKSLSRVRIAAKHASTDRTLPAVQNDLPDEDNRLVRNELRKMVEVAKRLSGDMTKMPTGGSSRAVERIQRKLGAVMNDASAMKMAASENAAARRRVVAHELEVRKQKLAEAEEEEKAAARAAKEAIAAEQVAMKEHQEAAADEAAAHERRVAARRARAIAARGEASLKEDKLKKLIDADESSSSVFAKTDVHAAQAWPAQKETYTPPSHAELEAKCTVFIASHGCSGLQATNPCNLFCGTNNDVRRAAQVYRAGEHHARTGFFASGAGSNTYVDSVYGDTAYDPSTYTHESSLRASALLAPEVQAGGFADVAADGEDTKSEESSEGMGSTSQVLRNEEALKRHLEGHLEQEQATNKQLEQRLTQQQSALRDLSSSLAYVSGFPLDKLGMGQSIAVLPNTPPLPRYRQIGDDDSQKLVEVQEPRPSVAGGVMLHNPASSVGLNEAGASLFVSNQPVRDPYRP